MKPFERTRQGPSESARSNERRTLFLPLSLALVVVLAFSRVLNNGFLTYDDTTYVTGNSHVTGGLNGRDICWAFETFWASNWHPVTWFSHMLDCQIFGLQAWGHHLTSLLLHVLNTVLVYCVLRRMTGALWQSAFVAALFGTHPMHVESVAWVAERKDLLSTLFWMLSLWSYARFVEESKAPSAKWKLFYALSLVFLALGLMSKPMLVTAPFLMLLIDYWPLGRWEKRAVTRLFLEKLLFFLLAGTSAIISVRAQNAGGTVASVAGVPLALRVENGFVSYVVYLEKLICPIHLAVAYPYARHVPFAEVWFAGSVVFAISAVVFIQRRRWPYLFTGWAWFLGTLVPVIGLVQIGPQSMADRYTYVPGIGVFIAATWGAVEATKSLRHQALVLASCGPAIVTIYIGLTIHQTGYWKDNETLFRHAISVTRDNGVAYSNLADYYMNQGRAKEAVDLYEEGIDLQPGFPQMYDKLGVALCSEGRISEGIKQFVKASQLDPALPAFHEHLAQAMEEIGQIDEAIAEYREVVRLIPDDAYGHRELGIALQRKGLLAEAIGQYRLAVQLAPDSASAHFDLAVGLESNGGLSEAYNQLEECLKLDPDFAEAHNEFGTLLGSQGRLDDAISQFREAIELKPGYTNAITNLSLAIKLKKNTRK
ncbi:MAG TPA: tetratricopeptide repeat protein [Verrucomicrobiae bacterium]|nr:tetratricopeptide repeat protein [Verrucomicrobiae bacterium]